MAQLAALRQRIKSVQTTKKITHAMRLISISLYGKTERQAKALAHYHGELLTIFDELGLCFKKWSNPVLKPSTTNNPLYIIISSSKGLCGGFHNNLERFIAEQGLFNKQLPEPTFITIGNKATIFIKRMIKNHGRGTLISQFNDYSSQNTDSIVAYITSTLQTTHKPYSDVFYISNTFKSFFSSKQQMQRLVPLASNETACSHPTLIEWEQPQEQILDFIAHDYLAASLRFAITSSLQSEHSARFLAMESATNNATEMLETLTLLLNKKRQTEITKEVSELSAGF